MNLQVNNFLSFLDNVQIGIGGKAAFTPAFFQKRQVLFGQLDNVLERLTMSKINIGEHPKIKHVLGLSSKSIIHNWDTIAATGEVPELGKRIKLAANMAKGASTVGWLAVGVDGIIAVDNIREACTGDDTRQCEIISYKEVGGFLGSAGAGAVGGKIGATAAMSTAVFLGAATGGVAIIAIGFIGAGVGAYTGSKGGDVLGEFVGEKIYEIKKEIF